MKEIVKAAADSKLLLEIYQDAAKPGVQQVGKALATTFSFMNTLLLPIEYLNIRANDTFACNMEKLRKLSSDLEIDDLVTVPQEIAVPIIEKLFYVSDDDLVSLFTKLLYRASVKEECHLAHPNFANIISSLSPDEARILNYYQGNAIPYISPSYSIILEATNESSYSSGRSSNLFYTGTEDLITILFDQNMYIYLSNMFNLGLLDSVGGPSSRIGEINLTTNKESLGIGLEKDEKFDLLIERYSQTIDQYTSKTMEQFNGNNHMTPEITVEFGEIKFSDFGQLFVKACCET